MTDRAHTAWQPLFQGEREESNLHLICQLFWGLLVSDSPVLKCRWDLAYSRCLGTSENNIELSGLLLFHGTRGIADRSQETNK